MATPEPEFSADISFSILENQDTGLENFDRKFDWGLVLTNHLEGGEVLASALGEVDVGFLTGGDASEELILFTLLLKLVEHDQGSGVENLVYCCSIILVFINGVMLCIHFVNGLTI